MIELVEQLDFLKDITESCYDSSVPTLFKSTIRVYEVIDSPNVQFKISSDWEGNWMAGAWYRSFGNRKIKNAEELFYFLSKTDAVKLAHNLDILEKISSWNREKYLR